MQHSSLQEPRILFLKSALEYKYKSTKTKNEQILRNHDGENTNSVRKVFRKNET